MFLSIAITKVAAHSPAIFSALNDLFSQCVCADVPAGRQGIFQQVAVEQKHDSCPYISGVHPLREPAASLSVVVYHLLHRLRIDLVVLVDEPNLISVNEVPGSLDDDSCQQVFVCSVVVQIGAVAG